MKRKIFVIALLPINKLHNKHTYVFPGQTQRYGFKNLKVAKRQEKTRLRKKTLNTKKLEGDEKKSKLFDRHLRYYSHPR